MRSGNGHNGHLQLAEGGPLTMGNKLVVAAKPWTTKAYLSRGVGAPQASSPNRDQVREGSVIASSSENDAV